MNGQLFTPGQAITLEKPHTWNTISGPNEGRIGGLGPKFGEIVHVEFYEDNQYMFLFEYQEKNQLGGRSSYNQYRFVPVVTDDVLAEELSEIFSEEIAGVK